MDGACGLETCTEKAIHDPQITEASQKVQVVYHPEYPKKFFAGEGRLDLTLKDGKTLTGAMDQPYGGSKYPLTMEQVVDIYRRYCKGILPDARIERLKDIILNMENEPDLEEMYDICTFTNQVA